jgi:hypothetical protein
MVAPWYGAQGTTYVAPATAEAITPPVVTVTTVPGDGTRVVTLDISSVRHAPRLAIVWHGDAGFVALRINGVTPPGLPAQWGAGEPKLRRWGDRPDPWLRARGVVR